MTITYQSPGKPGPRGQSLVRGLAKTKQPPPEDGWDALVGMTIGLSPIEQHGLALKGISADLLDKLIKSFATLQEVEVLGAVGISSRTIQRRKEGLLSSEHSGAALDLIEVTQKAMDVLGGRRNAENWLHMPALAFDGRKPIELLSTRQGADLVKNHLTRMEFGVYA